MKTCQKKTKTNKPSWMDPRYCESLSKNEWKKEKFQHIKSWKIFHLHSFSFIILSPKTFKSSFNRKLKEQTTQSILKRIFHLKFHFSYIYIPLTTITSIKL